VLYSLNIAIPQNIISAIFALSLPDKFKENVSVKESSLIAKEIEQGNYDIGLIPSCDLFSHKELYISKNIAISFDGPISNSYLYFIPEQNKFDKIYLKGDISSNEILLSKILFSERFDIEAEFTIDTNPTDFENKNYLITGIENNDYVKKHNGVSFSDQFAELIDYPYVNFLLAAKEKQILLDFSEELKELDAKIDSELDQYVDKLDLESKLRTQLIENFDSIYYELTDNELDGLKEMLRLPYYHGIIKEIVELNLV